MSPDSDGDAKAELTIAAAVQRIGRYELRGVLGRGAMGVVYRAYDTVLERTVALKTHHASFAEDHPARRRFATEVKTSSRLNHPGIVTVYDGGIETDVPFIAMELIEGTTLQAIIRERGKLPPNEALAILVPVGEALAYAHRQQVVHRDVKPANILIPTSGQPKMSDFGVAKALGSGAATTMLAGTPSHMAPEQVSGGVIDARVDVFALGVVAYETLTGRRPFQGNELAQIAFAVVSVEPPAPSEIEPSLPKSVDAVIGRALAKDPARRYADTDEFVHDLERAVREGDSTLLLPKEAVPGTASRAPSAGSLGPWIAAAAMTATAIGAVFWARSSLPTAASVEEPGPSSSAQSMPQRSPAAPPPQVAAAPPVAVEPPVAAEPPPAPEPTVAAEPAVATEPVAPSAPRAIPTPEVAPLAVAPKQAPEPPRPPETGEKEEAAPKKAKVAAVAKPPARGRGSLEIQSEPPGAAVVVNGKPRGSAPVELNGLASGSYDVSVTFPGVTPQTRTVKVSGGGSRHTITFRLSSGP